MVSELHNFGHLTIARRSGGEPVQLVRSPEELVFLGFDTELGCLVEIHVLRDGMKLEPAGKKSFFERARLAAEIRGHAFMRILDAGESHGRVYYTSNLNDGEFVESYIARRGALQSAIAFALLLQLLDELMLLGFYGRLVNCMRLDRVLVTTQEDAFLQLRLYDYGLSRPEKEGDPSLAGLLVEQACGLLFLMLTGSSYAGESPDRHTVLTSLPAGLRRTMRSALLEPGTCHGSLERLREEVKEALSSVVPGIQGRNSKRQLSMITALRPQSQLQDVLLEQVPPETILGSRFRPEVDGGAQRPSFSLHCRNIKNNQTVRVQLLPPASIVAKEQYELVPLQVWRFDPEKQPNLLRSLSLWESPGWTFLAEEDEPGFPLSRLLAERQTLNPNEVALVLHQVHAGLEQALDCGVRRIDLHPSNIFLRVGRPGPLAARENERLMQKRLDAWPNFQVKLRAHLTMRHLCEPPLVDRPEGGELAEKAKADEDYRGRSLVTLAAYLLTGPRQTGGVHSFPEATHAPLVDYMLELLGQIHLAGKTPPCADFLETFDQILLGTPGRASPSPSARSSVALVALEDMESAGSISDFENEWLDDSAALESALQSPMSRNRGRTVSYGPAIASPWTWAAVAAVVLALAGGVWLFGGGSSASAKLAADPSAQPKGEAESKPAARSEPDPASAAADQPTGHHASGKPPVSSPSATGAAPERAGRAILQPLTEVSSMTEREENASPAGLPAPMQDKPPQKQEPAQVIRRALIPTAEEIARYKAKVEKTAD